MGISLLLTVFVVLQLYDGGFAEFDPVIGVLCGSIPPADFTSSTEVVSLTFVSGLTSFTGGFTAQYSAIDSK